MDQHVCLLGRVNQREQRAHFNHYKPASRLHLSSIDRTHPVSVCPLTDTRLKRGFDVQNLHHRSRRIISAQNILLKGTSMMEMMEGLNRQALRVKMASLPLNTAIPLFNGIIILTEILTVNLILLLLCFLLLHQLRTAVQPQRTTTTTHPPVEQWVHHPLLINYTAMGDN